MHTIQPLANTDQEISEILELLRAAFPHDSSRFSTEYLDWHYRKNPSGQAIGFNAYSEGRLIAHYVTLPCSARVHGKSKSGVLSLNTATHPDFQGRGLFTELAARTYALARERGHSFVIGVANANSTPGFVRKLGFQPVCPLEARFFITGFPRVSSVPEHLDFFPEKTPESLAWRLSMPGARYFLSSGLTSSRNPLVFALTQIPGIPAVIAEPDPAQLDACYRTVKREVRRPLPVVLWIGLNPARTNRGISISIPMKLRPSPLNFIFKDLTGTGVKLNPQRVRFSLADFDAL